MKHIWTMLMFALMLLGCSHTEKFSYQVDETLTAASSLQVGQQIYEGKFRTIDFYRDFLGVTAQGHILVRDFYKNSDTKLTDPFLITEQDSATIKQYDSSTIISVLTRWHRNGQNGGIYSVG